MGDDELKPRTEDDGDAIDEEVDTTVELQMRKIRYEQQKFLKEKEVKFNTFDENKTPLLNKDCMVIA